MTHRSRLILGVLGALFLLWTALFGSLRAIGAEPPKLGAFWQIYNGDRSQPGMVLWHVKNWGWKKIVRDIVVKDIAWLEAADPNAVFFVKYPFGQYRDHGVLKPDNQADHLDGYDFAIAGGYKHITNEFLPAWYPICEARPGRCFVYLGSCHLHKELRDLPPLELKKVVDRNLKPLKDAGFAGVFIDNANDSIHGSVVYEDTVRNIGKFWPHPNGALLLGICDSYMGRQTGIELTPRRFAEWAPLHVRESVLEESNYQRFHAQASDDLTKQGWGKDRSYIKGRVYRWVSRGNVQEQVAAVKGILATKVGDKPAGDVALVTPQGLREAGVKAEDLLKP